MKDIIVICIIDEQLWYVPKLLKQLNFTKSIALGNYGSKYSPSYKNIEATAKKYNLPCHIVPREILSEKDAKRLHHGMHCHELIGSIKLSKYFYDLDFDNVILIHADVIIKKDIRPYFNKTGNWNFIVPKPKRKANPGAPNSSVEECVKKGSIFAQTTRIRFSQESMMYNLKYINALYKTNWEERFSKLNMHGDLALIDLYNDLGFQGILIDHCLKHGDYK